MDLAEWVAAKRWVALLEFIDMLPAACRLNEAIANDPEYAKHLASLPESEEKWSPRVSDFDLNAILLRDVLNTLGVISQQLVQVNGGSPKQPKPFPAPFTEIDRAKAAAEREFAEDLVGMFGFEAADL